MPVVLAGRPFGSDDDLSYVDADNVCGARMAVQYLLKHGPKLTTVRQPVEAIGEQCASELLALIGRGGHGPVHVVLDTELVIRESA